MQIQTTKLIDWLQLHVQYVYFTLTMALILLAIKLVAPARTKDHPTKPRRSP
ncbi:hypothetical protein G8759_19865 [Spirosoma aureum]|uniref:Uncharacterized protein n=1 Tax=Spirosoma aureum TaxID=2692134 RepID=A0A6G9AQQ9_9BACT|nr:hypothetical protein [Spirosoma aureum]QIP14708.1 hypothetical protein G8759_19865 [Spirosoma aureum]